MLMPDETYFAVVNDNPMMRHSGLVVTGPGDDLDIFRDQSKALDRRDRIRKEADNPDINVYRVTVHAGSIERGEAREVIVE